MVSLTPSKLKALDGDCAQHFVQKGKITEDGAIVCPWHRSAFDLRSGDVKGWSPWPPGVGKVLGMVSKEKALAVFPTRVEGESIWVDVED